MPEPPARGLLAVTIVTTLETPAHLPQKSLPSPKRCKSMRRQKKVRKVKLQSNLAEQAIYVMVTIETKKIMNELLSGDGIYL